MMLANQIAAIEQDSIVEFARQLYDACITRFGENHEQTRLAMEYISGLEKSRFVESRRDESPLGR